MTSKSSNPLDSSPSPPPPYPPPLSNHVNCESSSVDTLEGFPSVMSSCSQEWGVATSTGGGATSVGSTGYNVVKEYHSNPNMACSVPALTNIPISRHLRYRDSGPTTSAATNTGMGMGLLKGGRQNSDETAPSSFHVSFHGLGKDSFRLTNSDRTGFVDLATAAAIITNNGSGSNSSSSSSSNNSGVTRVSGGGGCEGGGLVINHNGTTDSSLSSKSKPDPAAANNLVLRSGTAANLRHRPYSVNHKTATKSS